MEIIGNGRMVLVDPKDEYPQTAASRQSRTS